jgi:hypothetical protein
MKRVALPFFPGRGRPDGFSRTDLLMTLAVTATLSALIVVPMTLAGARARLATCHGNLQQVARAVLLYADDHAGRLPAPVLGQAGDFWWWYKEQVKGYLGLAGLSSTNDTVFACPLDRGYSDPRPFSQSARFDYGSYVFNGVPLGGAPNIAGWRTAAIQRPSRTLLVMEWSAHAPLSWHRSRTGKANHPFYSDAHSVVAFVDGRVGLTPIYYDGYNAAYTRDPIPGYEYQYSGQ